MNKPLFKPLVLAMSLALGMGAAHAASNFDISELSKTINPCTDFNGYVNAKWIEANPIPADQTSWGAFNMLAEKSRDEQHQILEDAAKNAAHAKPGSIEQKLGWYYASGMDANTINKAGFDPIKPKLAEIAALKNSKDVANFLDASFNEGVPYVFSFGSGADFKDATNQIGYAVQDCLGLPTKDYYYDPKYKHLRDAYVASITKTLQITGVSAADAKAQASQVMAFETQLAKASLAPT